MSTATDDRGAILHFAARHALSPGLRGDRPGLAAEKEEGFQRCGWEPFFAALDAAGPALLIDDGDPAAARPSPPSASRPRSAPAAAETARRFFRALRGPPPG